LYYIAIILFVSVILPFSFFRNCKHDVNTQPNFLFRTAPSLNNDSESNVDSLHYQTTNTGKKERVFYTNNNRKHLGQLRATAIAGNDITSSIFYTVCMIYEIL